MTDISFFSNSTEKYLSLMEGIRKHWDNIETFYTEHSEIEGEERTYHDVTDTVGADDMPLPFGWEYPIVLVFYDADFAVWFRLRYG